MPTRQNRYFNNPQMAAAFSNLAGIFAPPSAQDFLAMAKTQGVDEQNARLSQLFQAAGGDFDRMGMAAGQWNPNQSFYAVDQGNAVTMRGQDVGAQNNLDVQRMRGEQSARETAFNAAVDHRGRQAISDADISAYLGLDIPGFDAAGPVAPTESQVLGDHTQRLIQDGQITDDMLVAKAFGNTPVEIVQGPNGPQIVTRPQAIGQAPGRTEGMGNLTRFLVPDETGELKVVSGFTTWDGRVVMPDGTDITHMNPIPASNSGGTQFEVGPDGQIRFSMGLDGLTNRTTSGLQGSLESSLQLRNSMTSLFRNLTPDALGVAGQFNDEFVNRVVAQFVPNAANLPVAAQRTQLRSAIVREARGILGNDRLNREDRERIAQLMPDPNTMFESFPRAQASLATIATYAAYDAAFAGARLGGETLPPLDPRIIGQLVDRGELDPAVAQMAVRTLFANASQGAAPAPGPAQAAPAAPPAAGPPPDPEAVNILRQNPSPQMREYFDEIFGPGAADRALGAQQ
jgi:hypothetical protein